MLLNRYQVDITKSEFRYCIALCYDRELVKIPSLSACNKIFTVAHALHRPKGGYTHMRHNDIRDFFSNLLSDVEIDCDFQLLQGETFAFKSTTNDNDARFEINSSRR